MVTITQNKILTLLLDNPEKHLSIRGIARELGKSYALVYNNIEDLRREGIIVKMKAPPAQLITINEFTPVHILIDIEIKKKNKLLKQYPWTKVMLDDIHSNAEQLFFILLIFGSYAKGTQTKKSDIDILIITPTKDEIKDIENSVKRVYTKVSKNLVIVDVKDFMEMLKNTEELNVSNEARKHHIILYGTEQYYQIIKKVYKR